MKEFDTYKFTEKNSTSTMHKLTSRDLAPHDFSFDEMTESRNTQIRHLNDLIKAYKSREGTARRTMLTGKQFQGACSGPSERLHAEEDSLTNYAEPQEHLFPAPPPQA